MPKDTPILDALYQYAQTRIPLFVPGHKQGRLLPGSLSSWLGAASKLDLTELPGLDNLQFPEGCILESEQWAAKAYGSDVCLYSVSGSTAGVMAAITASAGPGDAVLFLNRFHQSAWRALVLSGARPVMMPGVFHQDDWEFGFPSVQDMEAAVAADPAIRVAVLTSPTYPGRIADVRTIASTLHRLRIPLVVDEAHGAHLGIHPDLPHHSIAAGADVVVQSAHKMLPSLTQTAWVHCQGQRVDPGEVARWLRFLQSTSPSYLLLASLDAAQAWWRTEGPDAVRKGLEVLRASRELANGRDPFKVWVPTGSMEESERLAAALAERGVVGEYHDGFGVLGIHRLDVTAREADTVEDTIAQWRQGYRGPDPAMARVTDTISALEPPIFAETPRTVEFARRRRVSLSDAAGCVLGGLITPYPPGVPMAFPGQVLDADLRDAILDCVRMGMQVHGIGMDGSVDVLDNG